MIIKLQRKEKQGTMDTLFCKTSEICLQMQSILYFPVVHNMLKNKQSEER